MPRRADSHQADYGPLVRKKIELEMQRDWPLGEERRYSKWSQQHLVVTSRYTDV